MDYIYLAPLLPQWTKLNSRGDFTTNCTIKRESVVSPEPHLLQNKDPVPMRFVHPLKKTALHCRTVSQDESLSSLIGWSTNLLNLQAQHSTSPQHCGVCLWSWENLALSAVRAGSETFKDAQLLHCCVSASGKPRKISTERTSCRVTRSENRGMKINGAVPTRSESSHGPFLSFPICNLTYFPIL